LKEKFTLKKAERLKSRKRIEQLFREGKHFFQHPFKVYFNISPPDGSVHREAPLQAGVGVSSRNFKKAVDRNRVKRVVRECYRLQKNTLHEQLLQSGYNLDLFLIYTGRELPDFLVLKEKLQLILSRLILLINEKNTTDT
jgi:ribonuclease P protein component